MSIVIILLALFLYLLPSFVAVSNKKSNAGAITVLNLLLGWSVIFWIVALVWACTKDSKPDIVQVFNSEYTDSLGYVRSGK